ncbi:MAG: thioredoxin domain-containing protein [Nitrospirae bacterium]|nr:thioredoxin domain-containing protein [Nitrospirota bacterium]
MKKWILLMGVAAAAAAVWVMWKPLFRGMGKGPVAEAYLDFQDMSSRDFYGRAFKPLKGKYGKDVSFEVVPFPMPLHPRSRRAGVAIECAQELGKADVFIDALLEFFSFTESELVRAAKKAQLPIETFSKCLAKARREENLAKKLEGYRKSGIVNVPTFVLGDERITGSQPVEVYERAVLKVLGKPVEELKTYGVKIVYDPSCDVCEHTAYMRALKENFYPSLESQDVDCSSDEGRALMESAKSRAVPLYVFEKGIEAITSFPQIRPIFGDMAEGFYIRPDAYRFTMRVLDSPNLTGLPEKGSPKAKVRVIEFMDFHCPHCGQFAQNQLPILVEKFVKPGIARWSVAVYPLGAESVPVAQAAYCAGEQGKFWEYHDQLFKSQTHRHGREDLLKVATEIKLGMEPFKKCLDSPAMREKVQKISKAAAELGVNSTPTFFVGDLRIKGGQSVPVFEEAIQQKLKDKGPACRKS